MPSLCCICGESNGVHAIPNGKERRWEWIKFAGIEKVITEKKYWFLCNKHFEDRMFRTKERKSLVFSAFPTLHPPVEEGPANKDEKDAGSIELKKESGHQNSSQPKENLLFQIKDTDKSKKLITLPAKNSFPSTNISSLSKISDFKCNNVVSQVTSFVKHAESQPGNIELCPSSGTCSTESDLGASAVDPKPQKKIFRLLTSNNSSFSTIYKALPVKDASKTNNGRFLKICLPGASIKLISPESSKTALKSTPTNELPCEPETPAVEGDASLCLEPLSVEHIKSPTTIDLEPVPIKKNKNMKSDILLTAINNSDISFSDDFYGGEVVVSSNINNNVPEGSEDHSVKHNNKPPSQKRKKHYDPALIETILSKMKLKKNGPIRIVTLEKTQDRVVKAYTTNKLVTVYRQQIRENKKSKKILSGNSGAAKNSPDKLKNKRKCTCSVHCHRKPISSQKSPPLVNVSPGIGVKMAGTTINPSITNIDPYSACKELFNIEQVFNVSTILTNINDRPQIEQLCQMLIESIFKLKNLNTERKMAKLEVYISQMPSIGVIDKIGVSRSSLEGFSEGNRPRNDSLVTNEDSDISGGQRSSNFNSSSLGSCEPAVTAPNETNLCAEKQVHSDSNEASPEPLGLFSNINEQQLKSDNVNVRLSTYHDHCYNKLESNYIFEKPEYLVKLINIQTFGRNIKAKKRVRPLNSSISKNELARLKKSCQKLSNKIIHLRSLINKKNRNIKSMHEKIKYLRGVLCKERGIERTKYPKDKKNPEDGQVSNDSDITFSSPEEETHTKTIGKSKEQNSSTNEVRIDELTSATNLGETSFSNVTPLCTAKNVSSKKTKSTNLESLGVIYEDLSE